MNNNSEPQTATDIEQQLQYAAQIISSGQYDEGEKIARNILENNSENAQAFYVLGLAAYMRKDYSVAIENFTQASKIAPTNPMILSNLAESKRRSKLPEEALRLYKRTLKIAPGFNMALLGLANSLSDLNKNQEAIKVFQKLLNSNPSFPAAYHYLGAHLAKQEQYKKALPMLRKAVALQENYTDALMTLASTLENLDQVSEAIHIFNQILEQQPNNIAILLNLGNILKTQGKTEESKKYFDQIQQLDPGNLALQYSLSHSNDGIDSRDLESLENKLNGDEISKEQRRTLHFTLGKYYDNNDKYQQAFSHFKQANDMDDRIEAYDSMGFSKAVDQLIATFSKDFFAQRYGMGVESEIPVFIVGMPRSGTSLTEQILASHPRVYGAGELKNVGEIIRQFQQRLPGKMGYPACFKSLDPITACNLGERYINELKELSNRGDYARITDKMPGNNTNLGAIAMLLPRARIIHCKRNPMDSCFSNYSHNFSSVISYSRQLKHLGEHYKDYHRIMEHWKKVLPLTMLEVRYEDMVADNESMTRKILDFCGLEWDDACLDFQTTERRVKTASTVQVRQPIYHSSVERWYNYEQQLQPLYEALGELTPRRENGRDIYF